MATPSPTCTVGGQPTPQDITPGTVNGGLANGAGATYWFLQAVDSDDSISPTALAAVNSSLVLNQGAKTFSYTHPSGLGTGLVFMSTVGTGSTSSLGAGRDLNGVLHPEWTTTFKVNVPTLAGKRVVCSNEVTEQDAIAGWTNEWNDATRSIGWRTVLDVDFSTVPAASYGSDINYSIGGQTWTKIRSANDRAALATDGSTGLIFQPTAGNNGGGLYLPLSNFLTPQQLRWSSAFRVWVYIRAHNITNNGDKVVAALCFTPATNTTSFIPGAVIAKDGTGNCVLSQAGTSTQRQGLASGFNTNTSVLVAETLALDSAFANLHAGAYQGGLSPPQWPSESTQLMWVANAAVGSVALQDPSAASSNIFPNGFALLLFPAASGSTAALSVTIGRVRVDVKH